MSGGACLFVDRQGRASWVRPSPKSSMGVASSRVGGMDIQGFVPAGAEPWLRRTIWAASPAAYQHLQITDHTHSATAEQVASGRGKGGGAVPGRYGAATVNGRPEAGHRWTETVEPAAGPAESRLSAAGQHFIQSEGRP